MRSSFSAAAVLLLLSVFLVPAAAAETKCQDFLGSARHRSKHLSLVECKQRTELQGQPWQATFQVDGAHAAEIERFLRKHFKIQPLRRTCCVWESTQNSYRDKTGRLYSISMSTGETVLAKRNSWPQIPLFVVQVLRYDEAP